MHHWETPRVFCALGTARARDRPTPWPRGLRATRDSENRLRCSSRRRCAQTGLFEEKTVFQRSSRCCKMPLGLPPLPLPLAAPSVPAAEGLSRDTLVPAACPGQEPGLGPEEGIKYASNICSGALNNQPSPVRGDLQGPPPKPCPRGGRGMEGDVCPSCGRSSWRGLVLFHLLCSPLLRRKEPYELS